MSFIRLRKKNLIIAGAVGACLAGIPLAAAALYLGIGLGASRAEVKRLKAEKEAESRVQGYMLKHDLQEGHVIAAADLERIFIVGKGKEGCETLLQEDAVGKRCSLDMKKGTVLSSGVLYEGGELLPDIRIQEFTNVKLPEGLEKDDYIDIRIVFPDGEDYIVAARKKILEIAGNEEDGSLEAGRISLYVSEEEILRLASAGVDASLYGGTEIYAIRYVEEFQNKAETDYPVNPEVFALMGWNPNIGERIYFEGEKEKREVLDKNIEGYSSGTPGIVSSVRNKDNQSETEEGELEFFD